MQLFYLTQNVGNVNEKFKAAFVNLNIDSALKDNHWVPFQVGRGVCHRH